MRPRYRAWDKELQTMLDVSLIDLKKRVLVGEHWEFGETNFINFDDVNLMQSTGLFDKNGKEIFEVDVVRMRNPRDRRQIGMFQVVRVVNSPMLGLLDKNLTTEIFNLYEHMRNYYEIIGNVYENPEMLEVAE